jgi:hypothetical protein
MGLNKEMEMVHVDLEVEAVRGQVRDLDAKGLLILVIL